MMKRAALILVAGLLGMHAAEAQADDTTIVPLMAKPLGFEGKEGLALTVEYAPGASTPVHKHDAHVFVYVLEGAVTMQAEGGDAVTLGPGEMFYEDPEDVHAVSRNASDTEPAKFLVFFVKDQDKPPVIAVE